VTGSLSIEFADSEPSCRMLIVNSRSRESIESSNSRCANISEGLQNITLINSRLNNSTVEMGRGDQSGA
jgi:hypothetical protein